MNILKRRGVIAVVLLAIAFTAGTFLLPLKDFIADIRQFTEQRPVSGPVAIIILYALSAVMLFPGSALTILCGTAFGLVKGTIIVVIGSNLGALSAFLLSRTLFKKKVEGWVDKYPNYKNLYNALASNEWKIIFLTRLSPLFPYTLLNYFMGISPVKIASYATASVIGMLPGTFLYVYIGVIAGEVTQASSVQTAKLIFYAVGFLATILVVALVSKTAKKALINAGNPAQAGAINE